MFRTLILAAAATLGFSLAALASSCPSGMAEIDGMLKTATLSEADMTAVKELRARAEEEHNAGNHDASLATIAEAKAKLGM